MHDDLAVSDVPVMRARSGESSRKSRRDDVTTIAPQTAASCFSQTLEEQGNIMVNRNRGNQIREDRSSHKRRKFSSQREAHSYNVVNIHKHTFSLLDRDCYKITCILRVSFTQNTEQMSTMKHTSRMNQLLRLFSYSPVSSI